MRRKRLSLLLALSLLSAPCLSISYAQAPQAVETVTMQRTQYEKLKTTASNQQMRLDLLESKLNQLESNSTEASQELTALRNQLTECRKELMRTQEQLQSAEISLKTAEENLMKLQISLDELTKKIDDLTHDVKLAKRQRNLWSYIAGAVATGWLVDRLSN
jgi:chromosome segregation ATPase|nr:MAG TPA: chromosome segregation ATPase [Caudoviricetes sp.]